MKTHIKKLFFLPALIVGLGLMLTGRVAAKTFTTLHNFTALDPIFFTTNSDGAKPIVGLILSGNTLYGTADLGGSSGDGTVFKVNTDGSGFTTLYSFTATDPNTATNSDGANPQASLALSGNTLYGTACSGGSYCCSTVNGTCWGCGTVFSVNILGGFFTNLHNFTCDGSDGHTPHGALILSGNILYGTAYLGGTNDDGTVFAVNTNGTGFKILHCFDGVMDGDRVAD
jgi:uncharacterized repeat protein (TIGR03803 family)